MTKKIKIIEDAFGKTVVKNYLAMSAGHATIICGGVDGLPVDIRFQPDTSVELGINKFVRRY